MTSYLRQLLIEALVVGLVTGLAVVAHDPKTFADGMLLGVGVHLAFELLGANRYYCSHGAACVPA